MEQWVFLKKFPSSWQELFMLRPAPHIRYHIVAILAALTQYSSILTFHYSMGVAKDSALLKALWSQWVVEIPRR